MLLIMLDVNLAAADDDGHDPDHLYAYIAVSGGRCIMMVDDG